MENKKGELDVHLFCPKSTMNLTYLCYGDSNIECFNLAQFILDELLYLLDKAVFIA